MRLKVLTTTLMVFGLLLLAGWPWIIGPRPSEPTALREYTVRFGVYFLVIFFIFVATAVCSIILVRRAREEYRTQVRDNIQSLIEGALRDQQVRGAERQNEEP